MHESIVKISNNNNFSGSGFVVGKTDEGCYVVTCGHVIMHSDLGIKVNGLSAEVIDNKYDEGLDLALLYVEGLEANPVTISEHDDYSSIEVVGYTRFLKGEKREAIESLELKGDIVLESEKKYSVDAIKIIPKEPICSGYSGSPVLCKNSKNVIGIVSVQSNEGSNYAIRSKYIKDLYDEARSVNVESQHKDCIRSKVERSRYFYTKERLEQKLYESLKAFSSQRMDWVEPRLHTRPENSGGSERKNDRVQVSSIIQNPRNIIINARHQYGLTSLARYLVKEAWVRDKSSLWLYIDAGSIKPYPSEIEKHVSNILERIGLSFDEIECVVVDEFSCTLKKANKVLSSLDAFFSGIPLIIMQSTVENPMLHEVIEFSKEREFENLFIWALSRNDIRCLVTSYNNEKCIGDEDVVIGRLTSDLEVLNIPRTIFNCLTILKIYEVEFDESPVNRTEMIHRVLFLLFNVDSLPHYKNKPDLKDTEFVLGYFCEQIIKGDKYYFSRSDFLSSLNDFCARSEIDLDVSVIFDVLFSNNIFVSRGDVFCFKFSYWIFYFAAHRMRLDDEFLSYVLSDMKYAAYPEVIEFYTGIDRRRDNALKILTRDLSNIRMVVDNKCGLPEEFDIYGLSKWKPSEKVINELDEEISNGALNSNLPSEVKDEFADQHYDRHRPLNQTVYKVLDEYSLLKLMKGIQASAKALRNSDFSDPMVRHELLEEILLSWEQIIKVLIVLSPLLARDGYVKVDGAAFNLLGDFGEGEDLRIRRVISVLPDNLVRWYKEDLFSSKMGTLLKNHYKNSDNSLIQHLLNLLVIYKRPKGWDKQIEEYINNEHKNSFYLLDVYQTLRIEYQYSFATPQNISKIKNMIKMTLAKHRGATHPGEKAISRISDAILPNREVDE